MTKTTFVYFVFFLYSFILSTRLVYKIEEIEAEEGKVVIYMSSATVGFIFMSIIFRTIRFLKFSKLAKNGLKSPCTKQNSHFNINEIMNGHKVFVILAHFAVAKDCQTWIVELPIE